MKSINISESDYDFLFELSKKLNTQDNRITADPMFCVYEDNITYGFDSNYSDNFMWVNGDWDYYTVNDDDLKEIKELMLNHLITEDDLKLNPEDSFDRQDIMEKMGFEKTYFNIRQVHVNSHFTEEAALKYIERYGYNHKNPHVYVESMYRCHEMIKLREILLKLKK